MLPYQRQRRQTLTSVVSGPNESSRRRTISFNELPLLGPAALVERPMEGVISPSEIGSFDSASPTHGKT